MRAPDKEGALGRAWRLSPRNPTVACWLVDAHVPGQPRAALLATVHHLRATEGVVVRRWYAGATHELTVVRLRGGVEDALENLSLRSFVEFEAPPVAVEQFHVVDEAAAVLLAEAATFQLLEGILRVEPGSAWRRFVQEHSANMREASAEATSG